MTFRPDPTFYPSARMAMQAPPEGLAYVAALNGSNQHPDEIKVVDLNPSSKTYSQIVGGVAMPRANDELHHFGWNACSSALCPNAPHPHVERRYLVVPGLVAARRRLGGLWWRLLLLLGVEVWVNASAWDFFGSWAFSRAISTSSAAARWRSASAR